MNRTLADVLADSICGRPPELPSPPIDDVAWGHLLDQAEAERALGLLVRATAPRAMPATSDQQRLLHRRHRGEMRQALIIERELLRVADLLDGEGIELRVLKGVATAHLDHDDPADRGFQDVDVLVRPGDIDRAIARLGAAGYRRDLPPRSRSWDRRFAKDIALTAPSGVEVDVHRTLVPGAFGFAIDLDELWADPAELRLGSRRLSALGTLPRALHACYALTAGEAAPRLSAAADLVKIAWRPDMDVGAIVELAEHWRAGSLLAAAVDWVTRQLGPSSLPPELHAGLAAITPDRWQRAVRRTYRFAGGSNTATLLAGTLGLRRWSDRAAYARRLALPSKAYRHARSEGRRPREWRTGLSELVRPGRRA